jgi:hypothetical protein
LQRFHKHRPDEILYSAEVDLIAKGDVSRTAWLNAIGQGSQFHTTFGYYADPVDESTIAQLPKGWRARRVNLPGGDTGGVRGLCLDPHDLVIAKYIARREKDREFNSALVARGLLEREKLLKLVKKAPVSAEVQTRIREDIARDFAPKATSPARR